MTALMSWGKRLFSFSCSACSRCLAFGCSFSWDCPASSEAQAISMSRFGCAGTSIWRGHRILQLSPKAFRRHIIGNLGILTVPRIVPGCAHLGTGSTLPARSGRSNRELTVERLSWSFNSNSLADGMRDAASAGRTYRTPKPADQSAASVPASPRSMAMQSASSLGRIYSSGRWARSMLPGPQMMAGMPAA